MTTAPVSLDQSSSQVDQAWSVLPSSTSTLPPHPRVLHDRPSIHTAGRVPELDGIRGIAILLVLICHLLAQLEPFPGIVHYAVVAGRFCWSGVDLFFVLSGFLIGGILLDAKHSDRYYTTFYARRAFRILPIYFVLIAICALRYLPFHWLPQSLGSFSSTDIPWVAYLTFSQNLWMASLGKLGLGTLGPTWSLTIEEQFYLTMPFVIRKIPTRKLVHALIAVIVTAPLLRMAIRIFSHPGILACHVLMPCRADALSLGVLCAGTVRDRERLRTVLANRGKIWALTGSLFFLLCYLTFAGGDPLNRPMTGALDSLQYSVLALFYACFLILAVTGSETMFARMLRTRPLMQLGTIAYFTYLFHIPVIEVIRRLVNSHTAHSERMSVVFLAYLLGLIVTLILAQLSWRYFETPLIHRGRSFKY